MLNFYQILGVHMKASQGEILIALAKYLYDNDLETDDDIMIQAKKWLLAPDIREIYNQQLISKYPELTEEPYIQEDLGTFFAIKDKNALVQKLNTASQELNQLNKTLEDRINKLRSEEKIYRFPVRTRELLTVNYQAFCRDFSSEGARTVYFSLLQILARNRRNVRYVLYTESKGWSYVRYYEYTILKFKISPRKKYILSLFPVDYLQEQGLSLLEPSLASDGPLYQSRILIDPENPMYLEDAAIDHLIYESMQIYDYSVESILTFNEAVLNLKRIRVEEYLEAKKQMDKEDRERKKAIEEDSYLDDENIAPENNILSKSHSDSPTNLHPQSNPHDPQADPRLPDSLEHEDDLPHENFFQRNP